jgi:transaldolase
MKRTASMTSILDQLRDMTVVVADTGALDAVKHHKPIDCTTNPSLVLNAIKDPASQALIAREMETGKKKGKSVEQIVDTLTVAVGAELTKLVPGRVSTEVDARFSFNKDASINRARAIIADYAERGVGKERILIKLAATWEGILAAEILEGEGINCNLTLIFSLVQAIASANVGAYLISPFVGRITDWYKHKEGVSSYAPNDDPGVKSVREIYAYYKTNGFKTVVMGASFRNAGQIKALAGCDNLTISPQLLEELEAEQGTLDRALFPDAKRGVKPVTLDEEAFRWQLNQNAMATEKLSEGIRKFHADHQTLIQLIAEQMTAH